AVQLLDALGVHDRVEGLHLALLLGADDQPGEREAPTAGAEDRHDRSCGQHAGARLALPWLARFLLASRLTRFAALLARSPLARGRLRRRRIFDLLDEGPDRFELSVAAFDAVGRFFARHDTPA